MDLRTSLQGKQINSSTRWTANETSLSTYSLNSR